MPTPRATRLTLVLSIPLMVACAEGDTLNAGGNATGATGGGGPTNGGGGAGASSFGGDGQGGTANSTTTSSSSSSSSSSSANGGAGGGPACSEQPCKLTTPQCGCDPNEQCTVDATGRSCIPEGNVPWGQPCSGDNCAPGLLCLQTTTTEATCGKFCASDADCTAPGGLCILKLNDGSGGEIPNVTMCTDNCNPLTNVGCAVGGCQVLQETSGLLRFLTLCVEAGTGTQAAPCVGNEDCAPTFGCFNDGVSDLCLKWCNLAAPSCPAATSCVDVAVSLGGINYGVCY